MSVLLLMNLPGATLADYEKVQAELGLPLHDNNSPNFPAGLVSHVAGQDGDDMYVVDIWQSRADFDKFARDRLGPALVALGIPGRPQIKELPVFNTYRHGRT